jgi:GLE1-like protein
MKRNFFLVGYSASRSAPERGERAPVRGEAHPSTDAQPQISKKLKTDMPRFEAADDFTDDSESGGDDFLDFFGSNEDEDVLSASGHERRAKQQPREQFSRRLSAPGIRRSPAGSGNGKLALRSDFFSPSPSFNESFRQSSTEHRRRRFADDSGGAVSGSVSASANSTPLLRRASTVGGGGESREQQEFFSALLRRSQQLSTSTSGALSPSSGGGNFPAGRRRAAEGAAPAEWGHELVFSDDRGDTFDDMFCVDAAADELACIGLVDSPGEAASRLDAGQLRRQSTGQLSQDLSAIREQSATGFREAQARTNAKFSQLDSRRRKQRVAMSKESAKVLGDILDRQDQDTLQRELMLDGFFQREETARREEARRKAAALEAEKRRALAERQAAEKRAAEEKARVDRERAAKAKADAAAQKPAAAAAPKPSAVPAATPARSPGQPSDAARPPAATVGSAQDHPDCPAGIRLGSVVASKRRVALLEDIKAASVTMQSFEQWAALRRETFKKINLAVQQITGDKPKMLKKIEELRALIRSSLEAARKLGSRFYAFPWWVGNLVCEKFIDQVEQVVWKQRVMVYAFSTVAVLVCAVFGNELDPQVETIELSIDGFNLTEILLAHVHRACPATVPHYVARRQRDEAEWKAELGFKPSEPSERYFERMAGITAFYAGMLQTPMPGGIAHPMNGTDALWCWLARVMNMKPRFITGRLIVMTLYIAGDALKMDFGNQFTKIVEVLSSQQYLALLAEAGTEEGTLNLLVEFVSLYREGKVPRPPF